jgi:hypothetical protein
MAGVCTFRGRASMPVANCHPGLQCHTAPYSWKLVFEHDHQLFETTMTACSPKEELEWRSRLSDRSYRDISDAGEEALYTLLSLAIKPLGTVFGKPGTKCSQQPWASTLTI